MDVQARVVRVYVDSPSDSISSGATYVDVPVLADTTAADVLRCCLLPGEDESSCHLVVSSTGNGSHDAGNGGSHCVETVIEPGSRLLAILQRQLQQQKMAAVSGKVAAVRSGSGHADGGEWKLYLARRSKPEGPAGGSTLGMDQRDRHPLPSGIPSSSASLLLPAGRGAPKRDLSKGWSFAEIQQLALQQRQQMAANQELLADREQQLHELAALDMERTRQAAASGERLRHLQAHAAKQEARLMRVRAAMAASAEAVLHQKQINSELTVELDAARAEFQQKEKALAAAVAKVADLTRLLEQLRTEVKAKVTDNGTRQSTTVSYQNDRIEALQREYEAVKELREQRGMVRARLQESLGSWQRDAALLDGRLAGLQLDVRQRHQAAMQQQRPIARSASGAGSVTVAGSGTATNSLKPASNVAAVEPFLHNPVPGGMGPRGHSDLQAANMTNASDGLYNLPKEHAAQKLGRVHSGSSQQIISAANAVRTGSASESAGPGGTSSTTVADRTLGTGQASSFVSQSAVRQKSITVTAGKAHGQPSASAPNGMIVWQQQPQQQLQQPSDPSARHNGGPYSELLATSGSQGSGSVAAVVGNANDALKPTTAPADSRAPVKGAQSPLLPQTSSAPVPPEAQQQHQQQGVLPPAPIADVVFVGGGGGSISTARVAGFQQQSRQQPVAAASSTTVTFTQAGQPPGTAVASSSSAGQPPEQLQRPRKVGGPAPAMQPSMAASAGRAVTSGAMDIRPAAVPQSMLPRPWVSSAQVASGAPPAAAAAVAASLPASSAAAPVAAVPSSRSGVQVSAAALAAPATAAVPSAGVHTTTALVTSGTKVMAGASKQLTAPSGPAPLPQAAVHAVPSVSWKGPRPQFAVVATQASLTDGTQGSALPTAQLTAPASASSGLRQPVALFATSLTSGAGRQPVAPAADSAPPNQTAHIFPTSKPEGGAGSSPWTAVSPFSRSAPKDVHAVEPLADVFVGKPTSAPLSPGSMKTATPAAYAPLPGQVKDRGTTRPAMANVPVTTAAAAAVAASGLLATPAGDSSSASSGLMAPVASALTTPVQLARSGWDAASISPVQPQSPVPLEPEAGNSKTALKPTTDSSFAAAPAPVPQDGVVVVTRATARLDLELAPAAASTATAVPVSGAGAQSNQVTTVTSTSPSLAGVTPVVNYYSFDSQPLGVSSASSSSPSPVSSAAVFQPSSLGVAVTDDGGPMSPGMSSLSPSKKMLLETAALRSVNPQPAEAGGIRGSRKRRVSFDPLALLLDAALEGELELVKVTSEQVSNASAANDEGITALHNAICAGHQNIVEYLVEFGCDVNAQDTDGWTPLHCAASCNNLPLVKYLVEHGACVFAATLSDHETAVQKCEEGEDGYEGCHDYLRRVQDDLGAANDGVVYALYEYDRQNDDELDLHTGQRLTVLRRGDSSETEWWWACHALEDGGDEGYVPRNLLGMCKRLQPRGRSDEARD